jgi:hypothetical protein
MKIRTANLYVMAASHLWKNTVSVPNLYKAPYKPILSVCKLLILN